MWEPVIYTIGEPKYSISLREPVIASVAKQSKRDCFATLAMTGSRNDVIMEFINKYFLNRDFGIKKPVYFLEKLY